MRQRLHAWGFNTAGTWSLPPRLLKMPAVIDLALGKRLGFLWTDPFDPQQIERMRRTVRQAVAPFKGDPYRMGYFTDNEIGFVADGSPERFADGARRLWTDTDLRAGMGTRARAFVERTHSPPAVVDRWQELIEELV